MKNNALYIQSGGPTSVINASALGVIEACQKNRNKIGTLFASRYSFQGILSGNLVDVFKESKKEIKLLSKTPASIFGSSRHKMEKEEEYRTFLNVLKKYNINRILINGGNGTVRACKDIYEFLKKEKYDFSLIGIPKTVDNDIYGVDHTPGFPSAARHAVISIMELYHDLHVYDTDLIMIIEVMGRKCGWLAAATSLASYFGLGPDIIYVPETVFDFDKFTEDIKKIRKEKGKCMVVVSEGVKTKDGKYLFESLDPRKADLHMGGILNTINQKLKGHFPCKVRTIDLALMQRNAFHNASKIDIDEAYILGKEAVKKSLLGESGKFVSLKRINNSPYKTKPILIDFDTLIFSENYLPEKYIINDAPFIDKSFLDYIKPLVGELPKYAKLKYSI